MHPLRHSASFPTLSISTTTQSASSISPIPPLRSDRHDGAQVLAAQQPSNTATSAAALHSVVSFLPSSALPSPSSSQHYTFPSQPLTPPPVFGRVLPRLYRCCTCGSTNQSYLASLRLRCCLYVSYDALPASTLQFFQQQRIHLQLLCSVPTLHATLPAPTANYPQPLSIGCCPPVTFSSSRVPPSLPQLLKPALEYALSATSYPLLLLSSSPTHALLPQLVAALRSLQGWPLSSIADEWIRYAPHVDTHALNEAEQWPAEDELWLAEADKVQWWREEEERRQCKDGGGDKGVDGVEEEIERLFGSAFYEQRLISEKVVYDVHKSIVEDDDD